MKETYSNSRHISSLQNWGAVPINTSKNFPWAPLLVGFAVGITLAGIIYQYRYKSQVANMEIMHHEAKN
jgi:hypothetical protein